MTIFSWGLTGGVRGQSSADGVRPDLHELPRAVPSIPQIERDEDDSQAARVRTQPMDVVDALHRLSVVAGRPEVRPLDVEVGAGQMTPAHGAGRGDVGGWA